MAASGERMGGRGSLGLTCNTTIFQMDNQQGSIYICAKSLQLCPTFCNPMDCSPPGSSVHGTFQARILEWAAISSSGDLSHLGMKPISLRSPVWQVSSLPLAPPLDSKEIQPVNPKGNQP